MKFKLIIMLRTYSYNFSSWSFSFCSFCSFWTFSLWIPYKKNAAIAAKHAIRIIPIKIGPIISAWLLVSLLLTLVSCDSKEIKKLSYVDENGEVQTVSIKATDDENEVAAAIAGLSCKEIDRSQLNTLLANVTATIGYTGTNANTPFDYNLDLGITAGVGIPRNLKEEKVSELLSNLTAYSSVSAKGSMPMDFIKAVFHQTRDENASFDTSKPMVLNDEASLEYDKGIIYTKLALSNELATLLTDQINNFFKDYNIDGEELNTAEEDDNTDTSIDLTKYNNKVAKLNLSKFLPAINLAVSKDIRETIFRVFNEVFNKESSYKALVEALMDELEYTKSKTADPQEPRPGKSYYTYVKEVVHAFNIKITKTKGSKVTFTMDITKDSIKYVEYLLNETYDSLEGYDGHSTVELTIDAKTMLDITMNADFSDMYASIGRIVGKDINVTNYKMIVNGSLSTNQAIPTFSEADKSGATNASDVLSFLMSFVL